MAVSGSGGWIPAVRVYIYRRKLVFSGYMHNVPREVIWLPEQAAARFIDCPDAYIYVPTSQDGGTIYLAELLKEVGLID